MLEFSGSQTKRIDDFSPATSAAAGGHTLANLAAVERIPQDDPMFLKERKAYIGHLGIIPDTWLSISEPFLAISEDSNHSWYTEGFGTGLEAYSIMEGYERRKVGMSLPQPDGAQSTPSVGNREVIRGGLARIPGCRAAETDAVE